jgi:nucleotide-binding universal stress UspA family protein
MFHVRKILYATDFSSFSTQAYFHAVSLAESHRAHLTVMYVLTHHGLGPSAAERAYWNEQLETVRPSNPDIPVTHVLLTGNPATEIVRYASDTGMDVIVMGTHGRTGFDGDVLGSTAVQVMREAPCSVLVVKMPRSVRATQRPSVELATPV